MEIAVWLETDSLLLSDDCLTGYRAICFDQYFHAEFPSFIAKQQLHINCLELLTIVFCCSSFKGQRLIIHCDNQSSVPENTSYKHVLQQLVIRLKSGQNFWKVKIIDCPITCQDGHQISDALLVEK